MINWIWGQAVLVGTFLPLYIFGMIARKYEAVAFIKRKSLLLKQKLVNMSLFGAALGLIASYTINCLERLLISGRKNICHI